MPRPLVPDDFDVPRAFVGPGFRLEPLGPEHNERDHEAWMCSIADIRSTPGMERESNWPRPMTLDENLADLERHAREFSDRTSFSYSILDADQVIGCVYIYPSDDEGFDADVSSWVTATRAEMDAVVWQNLSTWLTTEWPFDRIDYAPRT